MSKQIVGTTFVLASVVQAMDQEQDILRQQMNLPNARSKCKQKLLKALKKEASAKWPTSVFWISTSLRNDVENNFIGDVNRVANKFIHGAEDLRQLWRHKKTLPRLRRLVNAFEKLVIKKKNEVNFGKEGLTKLGNVFQVLTELPPSPGAHAVWKWCIDLLIKGIPKMSEIDVHKVEERWVMVNKCNRDSYMAWITRNNKLIYGKAPIFGTDVPNHKYNLSKYPFAKTSKDLFAELKEAVEKRLLAEEKKRDQEEKHQEKSHLKNQQMQKKKPSPKKHRIYTKAEAKISKKQVKVLDKSKINDAMSEASTTAPIQTKKVSKRGTLYNTDEWKFARYQLYAARQTSNSKMMIKRRAKSLNRHQERHERKMQQNLQSNTGRFRSCSQRPNKFRLQRIRKPNMQQELQTAIKKQQLSIKNAIKATTSKKPSNAQEEDTKRSANGTKVEVQ